MQIESLYQKFLASTGVSTDTRKVKTGNIFFALKGENFDANAFAAEALEKGANFAVVDAKTDDDDRYIKVNNTLETLQELATYHRRKLGLPIVALTGSNGKTTTKEMINAVLSQNFKTTATIGNLNNHIGVPLTLLSMTADTEIGVVEMGANHQKEIEFLCGIAEPDYGYITNFGKAHLEGFGGVEGIIKGKKELYTYLKKNNKLLFLNLDDPLQKMESDYTRTYTFGKDKAANVPIDYPENGSYAAITSGKTKVTGKIIGAYNARNMAAAFCIGKYFEIPEEKIKEALENYISDNNRSQVIQKGTMKIILDAYNANPTSMTAALENLEKMTGPKNVILGDMFELGASAREEHQDLADALQKGDYQNVILVGQNFFNTHTSEKVEKYASFEDFKKSFDPARLKNSVTLIKGSRGMALERILELL